MRFYYYLFSSAYWVSVRDLKEKSAPQEYALMFVFVLDLLCFVVISGSINLFLGRNILSGTSVIIVGLILFFINYNLFTSRNKYKKIVKDYEDIGSPENKGKRIRTMVIAFLTIGIFAIAVAILNNPSVRENIF